VGSHLDDVLRATRARIGPDADEWVTRVPALLREVAARWELTLADPFEGGLTAFTVPAERGADGHPVVLRLTYPDGWFDDQTRAVDEVDGAGMVRLLDYHAGGAQLLERAIPGTTLLDTREEPEADVIAAGILRRIWRPAADGFVGVSDEASGWADSMPGRLADRRTPFDRPLVDLAVESIRELAATGPESLLLHGDLHHGNVLAASREPWLAIDPRPLVGEREFDISALLRTRRHEVLDDPDPHARLQRRFDRLRDLFDCDPRRLREWAFAILVDEALGDDGKDARGTGDQGLEMARLVRSLKW
jgi:streptomycin 6-kinase